MKVTPHARSACRGISARRPARTAAPAPASDARTGIRVRSSAFGSTRCPARIVARAISPYASSSANAGTGTSAGRESTRPSVDANSAFVTGFGDTRFTGPCRPVVAERVLHRAHVVVERDPAHPLTTAADRSAHAESEREQQPLQRTAVRAEHDPGAQQHDAHSRVGGGDRCRLPLARHPGEEVAARARSPRRAARRRDRRRCRSPSRSAARAADAPARRSCARRAPCRARDSHGSRAFARRSSGARAARRRDGRRRPRPRGRSATARRASDPTRCRRATAGRAVRTRRRTRTLRARSARRARCRSVPSRRRSATKDEDGGGRGIGRHGSAAVAARAAEFRPTRRSRWRTSHRQDVFRYSSRLSRMRRAISSATSGERYASSAMRRRISRTRSLRRCPRAPAASRRSSRRDAPSSLCSDRGCMTPPSSKYRPPVRTDLSASSCARADASLGTRSTAVSRAGRSVAAPVAKRPLHRRVSDSIPRLAQLSHASRRSADGHHPVRGR